MRVYVHHYMLYLHNHWIEYRTGIRSMSFFLHVYCDEQKQEIDLAARPSVTVGTSPKSDIVLILPGIRLSLIVSMINYGARVKANRLVEIGGKQVKRGVIFPDASCVISRSPYVLLELHEKKNDSAKAVDFTHIAYAKVGRGRDNSIVFNNNKVSEHHARFEKDGNSLLLIDLDSTNGTYVNGTKTTEKRLNDGDVISIADYMMIYSNGVLFFRNVGNDLLLQIEEQVEQHIDKGYPYFQQSPRLLYEMPSGEVEIQPPPQLAEKQQLNLLSLILTPMGMMIPAIITGALGMLYFSIPMALIGIIVALLNYNMQKKKHKRNEQSRLDKYGQHLKEVTEDLTTKANLQRNTMNMIHPSVQDCFDIVRNMKRRLWERTPDEKDFMLLRLGLGEQPSGITVRIPRKGISLVDDALLLEPERIMNQFASVSGIPVCVDMLDNSTVGIIGDRKSAVSIAKSMIVQASVHHSYEDVKIITLYNRVEEEEWRWVRWLPHSWDDGYESRYIADTRSEAINLLKEFEEVLKIRERELADDDRRDKKMKTPYLLFVIADKAFVDDEIIMRHIMNNNTRLGAGAIMLFDAMSSLPGECSIIVGVRGNNGVVGQRDNVKNAASFTIEDIDEAQLEEFARNMAPIRLKSLAVENRLPSHITFLQGYNVKKPDEIDIRKYWNNGVPYQSMSVPIGIKANGDPFHFDIWEKIHGPFGQVAGMPGSGKSEMMQTWILSMAVHFSPNDVSFVLIDFKGTGLLLPFMNLPHIAGTISDIDNNINRNLVALESEMKKRKELFDAHGVQDIKDYLQLYKSGKAQEPCPFVMIIVDEFAEMKLQFPEFMPVVDSIFSVGRSLGMYCVLMSQKPGGIVSAKVEANTKFRWCLRVASASESREMIGRPEASKITVPGRAYVKVGDDDVYELVQSYWSGAPYDSDASTGAGSSTGIKTVSLSGKRQKYEAHEQTGGIKAEIKEINSIIRYIAEFVNENNFAHARPIWMPRLKDVLPIEEALKQSIVFNGESWLHTSDHFAPTIGMIDDPYSQSQYPFALNIEEDGHIIVYGAPGTGKTTFLQTLAISLAMLYSPDVVNIYAMDFGSWGLKPLLALPHVGDVALDNEEEKIINLSRMILRILAERRQGFLEHGVNSIKAYSEAIMAPVPYIVLLVDNFAPVLELFPNLDTFFITLTRSGSGYGIYLVTNATALSGISYRVSQNIKQTIALQMIDKTDYLAIVGRTDGLEPAKTPGRGLMKGNPPLEFQTAVYSNDKEFVSSVREMGRRMAETWSGRSVPSVPVMPDVVTKRDFPSIPDYSVPLGLNSELSPVFFNTANRVALISGTERSGKTNALKGLADISLLSDDIVAYWFDVDEPTFKHQKAQSITDVEEMETTLQILTGSTVRHGNSAAQTIHAVLCIDNLPIMLERISEEARIHLGKIIADSKNTGICIYASGNYNELAQYYFRSDALLQAILVESVSIVTGGKFSQHKYLVTSSLDYSAAEAELPEFFGYYTAKGKTERIKMVLNLL